MQKNVAILSDASTLNAALEVWFLQNILLKGSPVYLDFDADRLQQSIVIYVALHSIDADLIQRLKAAGNAVVLYHLGDETRAKDISSYAQADLVLRNYFFKDLFADPQYAGKLLWVPNGYRTGVGPRQQSLVKTAAQRRFLSCFLGWLSNDQSYNNERQVFKDMLPACKQYIYLQSTTGFSAGFNVSLYASVLESSIYCPCPAGNSPETIRLYDVLEMGCIPIMLAHDFVRSPQAIHDAPFVILGSWEELPGFLSQAKAAYESDTSATENQRLQVAAWWRSFQDAKCEQVWQALHTLASAAP